MRGIFEDYAISPSLLLDVVLGLTSSIDTKLLPDGPWLHSCYSGQFRCLSFWNSLHEVLVEASMMGCYFDLELCVKTVISLIDGRLRSLESQDADECESALEALGQIGSSIHGAELLLLSSPPAARHVIDAAFDRQGRGRQLVGNCRLESACGHFIQQYLSSRVQNLGRDRYDSAKSYLPRPWPVPD
ncbi:hypothetical protein CK203_040851 [Vitis vinifera]|uniref:Uncharacterized protein n=1 Tax=Vitis vinifera TaxID=29760 RepID=A0A438H4M7_VITVI|nr:hypothetical protein CK203_040851 [Vitis vinifera]